MKITKVDVFRWETGINTPVGCRVYTDEGIYGDGEAALAYAKGNHAAFGAQLDMAPMVVAMDPMENEIIWYKLFEKSFWAQNGGPAMLLESPCNSSSLERRQYRAVIFSSAL